MSKRRVVVTGIGAITPLAANVNQTWERLINGQSGISAITRFDTTDFSCKIAGEVKDGTGADEFDANKFIDPKEQKKMDRFIQLCLGATAEAINDSGWVAKTEEEQFRTGVMIGSGIGGLPEIERTSLVLRERGIKRISPFFIPSSLANLASGHISIKYGFMCFAVNS